MRRDKLEFEFVFEDVTENRRLIELELAKFGFLLFELRALKHAAGGPDTQAARLRIKQRLETSIAKLAMLGYSFASDNFGTVWSTTKQEAYELYQEMKE